MGLSVHHITGSDAAYSCRGLSREHMCYTRERNEGRTLLMSRVVERTAAATGLSVSAITHLTEDGCAAL